MSETENKTTQAPEGFKLIETPEGQVRKLVGHALTEALNGTHARTVKGVRIEDPSEMIHLAAHTLRTLRTLREAENLAPMLKLLPPADDDEMDRLLAALKKAKQRMDAPQDQQEIMASLRIRPPHSLEQHFDFPTALRAVLHGLEVRRRAWRDQGIWLQLECGAPALWQAVDQTWIIGWRPSREDMIAEDWELLESKPEEQRQSQSQRQRKETARILKGPAAAEAWKKYQNEDPKVPLSTLGCVSFSRALELLKQGRKMRRRGWNGKGMWIVLMPSLKLPPHSSQEPGAKVNDRTAQHIGEDTPLDSQPYIAMWTADQKWQPGWLASQADMLAEDWEIAS